MKLNVSFRENDATFNATIAEMQPVTTLDSPHFTGIPTAPTAPTGTISDQIATTEFVRDEILSSQMGYGNIITLSIIEVTS